MLNNIVSLDIFSQFVLKLMLVLLDELYLVLLINVLLFLALALIGLHS